MLRILKESKSDFRFLYDEHAPLWDKIKAIATQTYGAADITADIAARRQLADTAPERRPAGSHGRES